VPTNDDCLLKHGGHAPSALSPPYGPNVMNRRPNIDALMEQAAADATWGDLALPPNTVALLRRIADRAGRWSPIHRKSPPITVRGFGVLFVGKDTAEKLTAAQAVAHASRRALYRVDLSAVTSKYIGETEKNLGRIFVAAEQAGALLYFDEADALFGKRGDVKDSHDRYAALELNFLFRSISAYAGVSILATPAAPSAAMLRRTRFAVYFR
jgi:ATPase family associated with various cellular activities (AAA)